MDKLWAPWRKGYITLKKPKGCIFCEKPKFKDDKSYIITRSKFSFSMLNIFPYNNGHLMVAPFKHTKDLNKLNDEELLDLLKLLRKSCDLLDKALKPEGYNIGINVGEISGAGYAGHLHIHIVPRWKSDTNFMPVITDTKVIPESLDSVYRKLKYINMKKYKNMMRR